MLESFIEIEDKLVKALQETAFMTITSLAIAVVLGIGLGLILYITSEPLLSKNAPVYEVIGFIANTISSIPFLILMIFFLPISAVVVGTKIGSKAVLVPLTVAAAAFFGRLAEASFSDVDKGVLEAVISSGARKSHVIFKIILPEAKISLIKNITVTAITVLGFSAMAGLVGGGGYRGSCLQIRLPEIQKGSDDHMHPASYNTCSDNTEDRRCYGKTVKQTGTIDMKEITWYGRGGQGAFTASRILGAAAMIKGYRSLAFPSFGPERRGAPIRAFTKISGEGIVDRSIVRENDYIIVLDDSLYDDDLLKSLKKDGHLLINTKQDRSSFEDKRVIAGDIASHAQEILKRPIVNIGILGLLINVDPDIGEDEVFRAIEEYMPVRVADKNIRLLDRIIKLGGKDQ